MNVALIGGVSSSAHALEALIRGGVAITGVLGLDESQRRVISDYRSLRPLAQRADLPFSSFVRVNEPAVERFLAAHPPDLLWVIGLSQMVSHRLVGLARCGGVGFHPTLLPEGRGRAPVAWTILRGARAAVSLFFLCDEPDAGDLIVQREVPVLPEDYAEDLIRRTNEALSDVVLELAPRIRTGQLPRIPQDHQRATYYPKRTPADGLIDWSQPTDHVYRLVRAAGRPYPGAFSFIEGRKLTVWRARPAEPEEGSAGSPAGEAGSILYVDNRRGVLVHTGDGALWLTETSIEGGRAGPAEDEAFRVGARLTASV